MYESFTNPLSLLNTIQPGLIQYVGSLTFLLFNTFNTAVEPLIPNS
nr:MAG TPA: hypothetical protein [Caudoviricetes sp.]